MRAASCSGSLCVAPPFSPSAQAKPRVDMCDLHCGEKFFPPPSLFISKASRPQRGCASHFDVCLFFYAFFAIALLTRLQAAENLEKEKKKAFSLLERITPLCCRFSSRSQFHRSARPRPPLPPPHVDTHAITRAIKKCREIKCAKAYGFFSCGKAFFLLLF